MSYDRIHHVIEQLAYEAERTGLQLEDFISMILDYIRSEKGNYRLLLSLRHEDCESLINTKIEEINVSKNSLLVKGSNTDLVLTLKRIPDE